MNIFAPVSFLFIPVLLIEQACKCKLINSQSAEKGNLDLPVCVLCQLVYATRSLLAHEYEPGFELSVRPNQ